MGQTKGCPSPSTRDSNRAQGGQREIQSGKEGSNGRQSGSPGGKTLGITLIPLRETLVPPLVLEAQEQLQGVILGKLASFLGPVSSVLPSDRKAVAMAAVLLFMVLFTYQGAQREGPGTDLFAELGADDRERV